MKMLSYVSTSIYMESRSNPFLQYHGEANKSIVQIKSSCESVCYVGIYSANKITRKAIV